MFRGADQINSDDIRRCCISHYDHAVYAAYFGHDHYIWQQQVALRGCVNDNALHHYLGVNDVETDDAANLGGLALSIMYV